LTQTVIMSLDEYLMLVTIHSDAGYSQDYNLGSWACWIKCDTFLLKRSGKLKDYVVDSTQCELMAIANALTLVEKHVDVADCTLLIKTDSIGAMKIIRNGSRKGRFQPILEHIRKILSKCTSYRLRHVKAHKYKPSHAHFGQSQYHVNDWCDKQASKHLTEAIKQRKAGHAIAQFERKVKKTGKRGKQQADRGFASRRFRARKDLYRRSQRKTYY
jgi:reverse transcriptase-like protein